jgi:NAD(P)-dependent dehydrogenase (short-subunit alcohol dehydrogenase family)
MTTGVARELRPRGITRNLVSPAWPAPMRTQLSGPVEKVLSAVARKPPSVGEHVEQACRPLTTGYGAEMRYAAAGLVTVADLVAINVT